MRIAAGSTETGAAFDPETLGSIRYTDGSGRFAITYDPHIMARRTAEAMEESARVKALAAIPAPVNIGVYNSNTGEVFWQPGYDGDVDPHAD